METKNLGLLFVSVFALFMFAGLSSAAVDFTDTGGSTINVLSATVDQGNSATLSFKLEESGADNLTDIEFPNAPITLTKGTDTLVSSNISNAISTLDKGESSATMSLTFTVPSNKPTGTYQGTLEVTATQEGGGSVTDELTVTIVVTPESPDFVDNFCLYDGGSDANPGDLSLSIENIEVIEGLGDDELWVPFDEIEIEVEVENRHDDFDVDDIEIEWGLWDTQEDDWVIEVDDVDKFNLNNDGDKETITFTFILDEDDMDIDLDQLDDGNHYLLLVRAVGEVDTTGTPETCDSESEEIEIIIEGDFVMLTNLEIPSSVSCGADLPISAEVWNIGDNDQEDVEVGLSSNSLGIIEYFEIGDLDAFEHEDFEVILRIPSNAEEGLHTLRFEVLDEDDDVFEGDFDKDNEESLFDVSIRVEGDCGGSAGSGTGNVLVSANLDSGGRAGEAMTIRAIITNTGDSGLFLINAAGYGDWANSVEIDRPTLTITEDSTGTVLFTFDVRKDVSGDQMFNIEVISDNELVANQPVSVFIESGSSSDLGDLFGENWYLWLIGLLNLILVIIIIIVAVRVSRK